jgi:membrane protein DedA with SNARE-associated domain
VRRIKGADEKVARVNDLLQRYGTWFILSFRFLYGIRNVASAACGLAGLNWARFAVLNFIAAGLWAASFVAAGWFLGALIGPERLGWTIAGIALSALVFFVVRHFFRRSRKARSEAV